MLARHSLIATLITAAAVPAITHADTHTVYVFNREYSQNNPNQVPPTSLPEDPTINVGDTVHWVHVAGFHTVTSCGGMTESFESGTMMTPGESFDHTFTHAGVFGYYCVFHGFDAGGGVAQGMAGIVTVIDAPPACTADVGTAGGQPGQDGALDNNDFIAFITFFFEQSPVADMAQPVGEPGSDGAWDNNDFIAFITHFFNGCG